MANRIPLIVDSSSQRIKELPSGDNLDLTGNGISAVRDILPETDSAYDLGSATKQWRDLYLSGNSIKLGGLTISRSGNSLQFSVSGATSTLPVTNGLSYATITGEETLTNKTINLANNTLSATLAQINSAISDADLVSIAGTETLTNKTLTSPTINGGTITNLSSITTTGNGTIGGNLTVTGDLTVNGTTTTISTTNLVIEDKNIILGDGATTDAAANAGGITLKGATDKTLTWVASTERWTSNQNFEAPGFTTGTGVVINQFSSDGTLSGNSTTTVPTENAVKTYVDTRTSASQTLTNKTINLNANTLTGTIAEFNTALSDADFATRAGTETLTNKTVNLSNNTLSGTIAQFNTALSDADFATLAGTETLTNKTINLSSNTLSATIAQLNTAVSDADLATLAGTETLTNKTLGATTIAGNLIPNSNEAYDLGSASNRFRDLYLRGTSIYLADAKVMFHTGKLRMNTNSAGNYPVGDDIEMPSMPAVANKIKTDTPSIAIPYVIALGGL